MDKETILILSYEKDLTSQEIVRQLLERGCQAVRLDTGDFPTCIQLDAACDGEAWQGYLITKDESIALEQIKSILYRRPTHYQIAKELPPQVQCAAENECSRGFGGILRSLPCFWISDIDALQLPCALEQACVKMVEVLGLNYSAIDIIRDKKDGTYYFLELNAAGQYHWIEYYTGLPITKAIVDLLIARRRM